MIDGGDIAEAVIDLAVDAVSDDSGSGKRKNNGPKIVIIVLAIIILGVIYLCIK